MSLGACACVAFKDSVYARAAQGCIKIKLPSSELQKYGVAGRQVLGVSRKHCWVDQATHQIHLDGKSIWIGVPDPLHHAHGP